MASDPQLSVRMPLEGFEHIKRAAQKRPLPVSLWARAVLLDAAKRELGWAWDEDEPKNGKKDTPVAPEPQPPKPREPQELLTPDDLVRRAVPDLLTPEERKAWDLCGRMFSYLTADQDFLEPTLSLLKSAYLKLQGKPEHLKGRT